jgi:hypothetical protein
MDASHYDVVLVPLDEFIVTGAGGTGTTDKLHEGMASTIVGAAGLAAQHWFRVIGVLK